MPGHGGASIPTGRLLVGTSGYSYKEWKGSFYPQKLPDREMLSFYAKQFSTVEINHSFYRMPSQNQRETPSPKRPPPSSPPPACAWKTTLQSNWRSGKNASTPGSPRASTSMPIANTKMPAKRPPTLAS